ncbi:DUF805 domain-containing protein [Methylomonas sp. HW2-6]|uniref:DUF805 domain-containing protein n=1 Tax=Methylomonas TaxID=416 RepID=UPI0011286F43|nr:DUF805 domain-containing protein [Methylomonas koyamae]
MLRYDRSRYIALGLPCLINAALMIYGLELKLGEFPVGLAERGYWLLAASLGLFGATAMIKRARDIGSSAWGILLGFLFAPPLMLLIGLVLCFVPSNPDADRLEPAPAAATAKIWLLGSGLLLTPWLAVLVLRQWPGYF